MNIGDRVNLVCEGYDEDGTYTYRLPGTFRGYLGERAVVKLDFGGQRLNQFAAHVVAEAKAAGFDVEEGNMAFSDFDARLEPLVEKVAVPKTAIRTYPITQQLLDQFTAEDLAALAKIKDSKSPPAVLVAEASCVNRRAEFIKRLYFYPKRGVYSVSLRTPKSAAHQQGMFYEDFRCQGVDDATAVQTYDSL